MYTQSLKFNRRTFAAMCSAALVCLASSGFGAAPAPTREQAQFEVRFLKMMVDHHYGAVKMAELCQGRAVHPELIALCESIKTTQTAEIEKMRGWLRDWYGTDEEPSLTPQTRRDVERLSRLTGAAFEVDFMITMIGHHSMAIRMGVDALNEAYHAELLNMAAEMNASQSDEIVQMRLWLMQWYNISDIDRGHRRGGH